MDDSTRKALAEGLAEGIRTERTGQHFYRMASRATEDEKGTEVFDRLAEEEHEHETFLTAHLKSLQERGELDAAAVLGRAAELSGDNPVFSDAVKARAGRAHAEMSALGVGIQIELSSMRFYRDQTEKAPSEDARTFFEALAEWESVHYHGLLRAQEDLKEDYWSAGGFAPF
jgi:rubrerythrin